jgi:hypothetical protein
MRDCFATNSTQVDIDSDQLFRIALACFSGECCMQSDTWQTFYGDDYFDIDAHVNIFHYSSVHHEPSPCVCEVLNGEARLLRAHFSDAHVWVAGC